MSTIRVLYVDDSDNDQELIRHYLRRLDESLDITCAGTASEALNHLEKEHFHCIISDYYMPGVDGLELLRAVRERHASLPFIILTGVGDEDLSERAGGLGVDMVMTKGSDPDYFMELSRAVNVLSGRT
jgi:CheY-like chemotaxis protein